MISPFNHTFVSSVISGGRVQVEHSNEGGGLSTNESHSSIGSSFPEGANERVRRERNWNEEQLGGNS